LDGRQLGEVLRLFEGVGGVARDADEEGLGPRELLVEDGAALAQLRALLEISDEVVVDLDEVRRTEGAGGEEGEDDRGGDLALRVVDEV